MGINVWRIFYMVSGVEMILLWPAVCFLVHSALSEKRSILKGKNLLSFLLFQSKSIKTRETKPFWSNCISIPPVYALICHSFNCCYCQKRLLGIILCSRRISLLFLSLFFFLAFISVAKRDHFLNLAPVHRVPFQHCDIPLGSRHIFCCFHTYHSLICQNFSVLPFSVLMKIFSSWDVIFAVLCIFTT